MITTLNLVEFVGGPFDGKLLMTDALQPIPIQELAGTEVRTTGHYHHGTGGQRGKMIWFPVTPD